MGVRAPLQRVKWPRCLLFIRAPVKKLNDDLWSRIPCGNFIYRTYRPALVSGESICSQMENDYNRGKGGDWACSSYILTIPLHVAQEFCSMPVKFFTGWFGLASVIYVLPLASFDFPFFLPLFYQYNHCSLLSQSAIRLMFQHSSILSFSHAVSYQLFFYQLLFTYFIQHCFICRP